MQGQRRKLFTASQQLCRNGRQPASQHGHLCWGAITALRGHDAARQAAGPICHGRSQDSQAHPHASLHSPRLVAIYCPAMMCSRLSHARQLLTIKHRHPAKRLDTKPEPVAVEQQRAQLLHAAERARQAGENVLARVQRPQLREAAQLRRQAGEPVLAHGKGAQAGELRHGRRQRRERVGAGVQRVQTRQAAYGKGQRLQPGDRRADVSRALRGLGFGYCIISYTLGAHRPVCPAGLGLQHGRAQRPMHASPPSRPRQDWGPPVAPGGAARAPVSGSPVVVQREHQQLRERRERRQRPGRQAVVAQPKPLQGSQVAQRLRDAVQRVVAKVCHARPGDSQRGRRHVRQRRPLAAQRDDPGLGPDRAARLPVGRGRESEGAEGRASCRAGC